MLSATIEFLDRCLETALVRGRPGPVRRHEAEERFIGATFARTLDDAALLLGRALQFDPGHVDAALMLYAVLGSQTPMPLDLLEKIVAVAAKRVGRKGFSDKSGKTWKQREGRSYMIARDLFARMLFHNSKSEMAIAEWEAMLAFDPADEQGVRHPLLAVALAVGRHDIVARLYAAFDEVGRSVVFSWGRMLERWMAGDLLGAQEALVAARRQIPNMEDYLVGRRRPPSIAPRERSPGSPEEAAIFAGFLAYAWRRHPQAIGWLRAQAPIPGLARTRRRGKRKSAPRSVRRHV